MIVNLLGLLQTVAASSLILRFVLSDVPWLPRLHELIAHFLGLMLPAVTSYFGHRYFTFRR